MKRLAWITLGATAAGLGLYAVLHARNNGTELSSAQGPRVAILGAGFAGLTAARELRNQLGGGARITLVDKHNYHLFTPMLYQVATWALDPYDVALPIRDITGADGIQFRIGTVKGIDFDARRVQLDNGDLDYDYLVIALGTTTNFFGNQGAEQNAYGVKWLEDGVAISNRLIDRLEQAVVTADPEQRKELLSFVVVGGGATGVESAAALADLLDRVLSRNYPTLDRREVKVILIEALGKLLGQMNDRMAEIALRRLRENGVEVWLNAPAKEVTADHVTVGDGRTIKTRTILWTTGVRVPEVVANLQTSHGKGGSLLVDAYLRLQGRPEVYAIGDCAHFEDPDTHKSAPLLAQAANQEGLAAARNLARQIRGEPLVPFHFHNLGEAIALGRWTGVMWSGPVIVDGLVGWLGWRLIHLMRITSARDKLASLLDWSAGYFTTPDTSRLALEPIPEMATGAPAHA